jgi:predicted MFS family arabinose efflux permease
MGALSILLIAAGAILTWAVTDNTTGFDIHTIGIILLVVGIVGLIASLARGTFMGFSTSRERHVSTDGRTVVESERTTGF